MITEVLPQKNEARDRMLCVHGLRFIGICLSYPAYAIRRFASSAAEAASVE